MFYNMIPAIAQVVGGDFIFFVLCILVIVPSIVVVAAEEDNDLPAILSNYHVTTNVNSRMLKTTIDMVFENPNPTCSDTKSLTLQLPREARLTNLIMDLSDGCVLNSTVKVLEDAIQDFDTMSEKGQAAALLTAWDMTNYNLKVSIPPNGTTNVLLNYQELLSQKLDRVSFDVPLFPGTYVGELQMDITVEDSHSGILDFGITDDDFLAGTTEDNIPTLRRAEEGINSFTSNYNYVASDVSSESSLPTLLPAYYQPGPLDDSGLLLTDGECFTHLFNPSAFLSDVGSMARKIIFVIDISGSMEGQKLQDAKASFASMIDTLDERDNLLVQAFSDEGTEKIWGPKSATDTNKVGAKEFVTSLYTIGGTNLNQAFLDGISRVYDVPNEVAPVLVILTDGQGNIGPKVTAESVLRANEGQKVKIFSLAFGYDADMDLLLAIAIQNGGRATRIYEGFGDSVSQMELFFKQELGKVMLSDIDVSYDFGDVSIQESTVAKFPVLASGSEIVVRGLVGSPIMGGATLKSTIVANSAAGPKEWSSEYQIIQDDALVSDCRASFAQARIMELLEYRDAERVLGNDLFGVSRSLTTTSFEDQARDIALNAHLVWPGLTALVSLENTACQQKTYEVCSTAEGDTGDQSQDDAATEEAEVALDMGVGSTSSTFVGGAPTSMANSGGCTFVTRSTLLMAGISVGLFLFESW